LDLFQIILQVGPPLIRSTPSGVLLSHIQILLNEKKLGYNKDNKICRAEFINQPSNVNIDLPTFRQKLENALAPHSTLLHPLIELQVAAPLVRDLWKCLGFSKMKHCLKYAEENGIILCDWKMRDDTSQPWIALASSMKPLLSLVDSYFEQTSRDNVDVNIIKSRLERKYGFIRPNVWSDILTVASKCPTISIRKNAQNILTFYSKDQSESISEGSSELSALSGDSNPDDGHTSSTDYNNIFNIDEIIEEEAPEISFNTDFQNLPQPQKNNNNHTTFYDPKNEPQSYDPLLSTTSTISDRTTGLQKGGNDTLFHTSPFTITKSTNTTIESNQDIGESRDNRDSRFSFFVSQPKFLSQIVINDP